MKEATGSVLQRFFAVDGGSAVSLAWLRGAREWCAVVNASAIGKDERGNEGAEADGERQSGVGGRSAAIAGRGENNFSFGPTARRDNTRGGGCMRHAWSRRGGRSTVPASGRRYAAPETDKWAPTFFYLLRFSNTHTLIF
jgi:hypothetical protein